jgi:hypothetical protein
MSISEGAMSEVKVIWWSLSVPFIELIYLGSCPGQSSLVMMVMMMMDVWFIFMGGDSAEREGVNSSACATDVPQTEKPARKHGHTRYP